jgi:outer membrane protein assembly factor BamB
VTIAPRGDMPRIFVSYSQEDSDFCLRLVQDLRQSLGNQDAVWYEVDEGIARSAVLQELAARPFFIVILSPSAMNSPRVQHEIDLAWEQKNSPAGKEIIPVLHLPCPVIRDDLKILHMVNLLFPHKYEIEFDQLLKGIRKINISPEVQDMSEESGLSGLSSSGQNGTKDSQLERCAPMIDRRKFVVGIGLALGAAATVGIIVYSWISNSMAALTHRTISQSAPRARWHYETAGSITDTPVVVNGVVYATSQDGNLYALDAMTGKLHWSYHPTDQTSSSNVFSAPFVVNENVYVAWGDQFLYALDASNGRVRVRWYYVTSGQEFPNFSPTVADGVVYASSSDNYLVYAFDERNGKLITRFSLTNAIGSFRFSPTVIGGVIYLSTVVGHIYAFDVRSHQLLWDSSTTGSVLTPVVVSNGLVYVGSQNHQVYAIDAKTGTFSWQYTTGDFIRSAPTIANGVLYVGSADQYLYALGASNGKLLWSYKAAAPVGSTPALAAGKVCFTADDRALYAVDAGSGRLLWHYPVGNGILTSPQVANSVAYIGSSDNTLYALDI